MQASIAEDRIKKWGGANESDVDKTSDNWEFKETIAIDFCGNYLHSSIKYIYIYIYIFLAQLMSNDKYFKAN